jgi:hypothetical protein
MSAIISTRLMAAIVYWILVRDSSLAFRDGRLWSPTTSPDIMFWCVLVPAGAPHIMSGSPTERSTPAWRVEAGQTLTNVNRKRLTIPACPSYGFFAGLWA